MGQLSVRQYDAIERAIVDASRVAIERRGTEFLVIPEALTMPGGRESIVARHPTTGARLVIPIDEIDALEVIPSR